MMCKQMGCHFQSSRTAVTWSRSTGGARLHGFVDEVDVNVVAQLADPLVGFLKVGARGRINGQAQVAREVAEGQRRWRWYATMNRQPAVKTRLVR